MFRMKPGVPSTDKLWQVVETYKGQNSWVTDTHLPNMFRHHQVAGVEQRDFIDASGTIGQVCTYYFRSAEVMYALLREDSSELAQARAKSIQECGLMNLFICPPSQTEVV